MQSFCGIGKRKLHDQASEISDCWDYCCSDLPILKKFNAVSPRKSSVDYPSEENIIPDDDFDFSYMSELLHDDQADVGNFPDVNLQSCDQSSQGGYGDYVEGFLQSENPENILISAAMNADNLKVLNGDQEIETGSTCTNTYSFPTLMDVQSALLRENQSGAVSAKLDTNIDSASNSSSMSSVFNSFYAGGLRSQTWFPSSGLKRDHDILSQSSSRSFSRSIDELFYRRMNRAKSESKYSLNIKCPGNNIDDGYRWRKYGQKAIKNSPHPRSYYRCTNPRCFAKKQVERSAEDPETITITYEGLHMHYSYTQIQLTQPNNNSSVRRLQGGNSIIIEDENPSKDHKGYYNNNNVDKGAIDPITAPSSFKRDVVEDPAATVAVHQRHHQEEAEVEDQVEENCERIDGRCDTFGAGGSCGGDIGVVEHGGGRADGLLQDIVPLGIINPFPSSSSSSSSSSP